MTSDFTCVVESIDRIHNVIPRELRSRILSFEIQTLNSKRREVGYD